MKTESPTLRMSCAFFLNHSGLYAEAEPLIRSALDIDT